MSGTCRRRRCSTSAASWSRFQEPSIRQHQGIFDPSSLGFPAATTQYFGDNKYFPRFEFQDGSFSRSRGFVRRRHQREHLLVPADLDVDPRQPQLPVRRRLPRLSRGELPQSALGRPLRLLSRQQLAVHQAAGQLSAGGDRPGPRGHAARVPERRHHRPQHRSLQPGHLRRRVHPGRLEGEQQADAEPRPALGVRGGADRARQPQRARMGSGCGARDHVGGAVGLCAQSDPGGSGQCVPRARRADVRRPTADRGTYNPDKNNFQPRVGFAYQLNEKTVLRGGWAIYAVPALFDISGIYQPGFSQATNIVPSTTPA